MTVRTGYLLMVPLLGILAIFQTVVGPHLALAHVRPDLVLLVVLAWTLHNGSRVGLVWAFVGGVWMDLLSGGPMGGSSLALMAAVLVVGIGHRRFSYTHPFVPLVAALLGTVVYSCVYLLLLVLFGYRYPLGESFLILVLPATLYNSVLMLPFMLYLNRWLGRQEWEAVG